MRLVFGKRKILLYSLLSNMSVRIVRLADHPWAMVKLLVAEGVIETWRNFVPSSRTKSSE